MNEVYIGEVESNMEFLINTTTIGRTPEKFDVNIRIQDVSPAYGETHVSFTGTEQEHTGFSTLESFKKKIIKRIK